MAGAMSFSFLAIIAQATGSLSRSFHFLASSGMACYEGSDDRMMKVTVALYKNTIWASLFENSTVASGDCASVGYIISTTSPEECSNNVLLHVFLDTDAKHSYDWVQSERNVVQNLAAGNQSEAQRILANATRASCTKPQIMQWSEPAVVPDAPHPGKRSEWIVGRTAAVVPANPTDKQAEADAAIAEAMRAQEEADDLAMRASEAKAKAEQASAKADAKRQEMDRAAQMSAEPQAEEAPQTQKRLLLAADRMRKLQEEAAAALGNPAAQGHAVPASKHTQMEEQPLTQSWAAPAMQSQEEQSRAAPAAPQPQAGEAQGATPAQQQSWAAPWSVPITMPVTTHFHMAGEPVGLWSEMARQRMQQERMMAAANEWKRSSAAEAVRVELEKRRMAAAAAAEHLRQLRGY